MESKTNASKTPDAALCLNCHSFFANPLFKGFCSKCFKEANPAPASKTPEPAKAPAPQAPARNQPSAEQKDHEACWSCQKRVGISGFLCRCGFTFCKKHRLPESHPCGFDFKEQGKKLLAEQNQRLEGAKVEKID